MVQFRPDLKTVMNHRFLQRWVFPHKLSDGSFPNRTLLDRIIYLFDWSVGCLVDCLGGWLLGWMFDWLVGRLAGWVAGLLTQTKTLMRCVHIQYTHNLTGS